MVDDARTYYQQLLEDERNQIVPGVYQSLQNLARNKEEVFEILDRIRSIKDLDWDSFFAAKARASTHVECSRCGLEHRRSETQTLNQSVIPPHYRNNSYRLEGYLCPSCYDMAFATLSQVCAKCSQRVLIPIKRVRLCDACWSPENRREMARVRAQNARAIQGGLAGNLSYRQWYATLDYYNWTCAHCKGARGPYTDLDHVVPISCGGGTTALNCAPSCQHCNHPNYRGKPTDRVLGELAYLHGAPT